MRVVFVSNYINHHQMPFCQELYLLTESSFTFIQTEPMEEERKAMGWSVDIVSIPYVRLLEEDEVGCKELIDECDMLLLGWTVRNDIVESRLCSDKLTLRISERLYKDGRWRCISPRGLIDKYKQHTRHNDKNIYLLCAGGYVAGDYALFGAYKGKRYKFGYFTEFISYNIDELLINKRREKTIRMVWAGRFIEWKHPQYIIKLAKKLKDMGYLYHIYMIGSGELYTDISLMIESDGLIDNISLMGYMTPNEVRCIMEESDIHLFTSDNREGWGAVLNESMNSGCVPIANINIGAVPYLIRDGINGLVYRNNDYSAFETRVIWALDNSDRLSDMGKGAYHTIADIWNPSNAAKAVMEFYDNWHDGEIILREEGPMSVAKVRE